MPTAHAATHYAAPTRLTPTEAADTAKRGRKLLRRGELTHSQIVLLDCLLWCCRRPDTGAIVVSYTALQRLAHMARETVARGLRALERVGLLTRTKRRLRLAWHQGGVRVRQLTNAYRLHPPAASHCEFGSATVNQGTMEFLACNVAEEVADTARATLAAIAERRRPAVQARLLRGNSSGTASVFLDTPRRASR